MTAPIPADRDDSSGQLEYWLRRAEQESIAAIQATSAIAAERHYAMARSYSGLALMMLERRPVGERPF